MSSRVVVSLFVGALGVACVGSDPDPTPLGNTSSSGGTSGAPTDGAAPPVAVACPAGCIAPPPEGWSGPSALYDGAFDAKPADCPAAYPHHDAEEVRPDDLPPPSCACGPSALTMTCGATFTRYNDAQCVNMSGSPVKIDSIGAGGKCPSVGTSATTHFKLTTVVTTANCADPTYLAPLLPFTKRAVLACGPVAPTACAGNAACTTAPAAEAPFDRVCIHSDGDVACPNIGYPVRFVAGGQIVDTRACSPCTNVVPTCGTKAVAATGTSCGGSKVNVTTDTCAAASAQSIDLAPMFPAAATCEVKSGTMSGSLGVSAPRTFCCNK